MINLAKKLSEILLWFIVDHNGKPSTTRLILWVWTVFSISWINQEVHILGYISDNAVLLVLLSMFGPTIAIMAKKAPDTAFTTMLSGIFGSIKKGNTYSPIAIPQEHRAKVDTHESSNEAPPSPT